MSIPHLTSAKTALRFPKVLAVLLGLVLASVLLNADKSVAATSDDAPTQGIAEFYFSRLVGIVPGESSVIPFSYPTRPTVTVMVGDQLHNMLFDTGTLSCIWWDSPTSTVPVTMQFAKDPEYLAWLETKLLTDQHGTTLCYGLVPSLRLGDYRLRDVPFRVYQPALGQVREVDYTGAFAPILLRDYLIEVSNSTTEIRLHDRAGWIPPAQAALLPMLNLPRGLFIPAYIGKSAEECELMWFHLDTGFSGALGVSKSLVQTDGSPFTYAEEPAAEQYPAWHGSVSLAQGTVGYFALATYPALNWLDHSDYAYPNFPAVDYPDVYSELVAYKVGGIIGGALLGQYDYTLDYELARLYLVPRKAAN